MDFALSARQRDRRAEILAAAHPPNESPSCFDRAGWLRAAALGLTGACLPAEHGGGGLGALDTALELEAYTMGGADTGLAFAVAAHLLACGVPVREHAGAQVRGELLRGLAAGDLIAANAMTEDGAGSDTGALATRARRDGEVYVLDGEKSFVSNAPVAGVFVTYAVTDPAAGFLGITAFAVPHDLPGVAVGPALPKMGLDGCHAARVRFTGCRVPARYRLGAEGSGAAVFRRSMAWERACLPAIYLGVMERQLDRCVGHAGRRRQFGRNIGGFQAVSHRLAGMKLRLESARLLLYRACWQLDQASEAAGRAAALAKVAVSEAAVANALDAVQLFGAAGYLRDGGIEEHLRDAVPSTIFSGTTDMQKELIARGLGL
ncbi:acyl-CoA dehydrogenase family protein [Nonomuraea sp. NN258]|uniref:acyl-CoA dehydrogenase family protein n=1 Tax=Nonomuraea antri TaxID=2730852 RepID=UPI00156A4F3D|nr:acyl-CoA dehydrogenase family protein [Nonomuraea antri]NRQ31667.1 acyl-CoA dehydrogenase family protein [Nonomuraea antri]